MIPKEVNLALTWLHTWASFSAGQESSSDDNFNIINGYLDSSDRYMRELEQHVDDLAARGNDE